MGLLVFVMGRWDLNPAPSGDVSHNFLFSREAVTTYLGKSVKVKSVIAKTKLTSRTHMRKRIEC